MPDNDRRYRGDNKDIITYIRDLERRVRTLERTAAVNQTSIDNGTLRVKHPNGNVVAELGKVIDASDGSERWGLAIYDPDGTQAGLMASDNTGDTKLEFRDPAGRPVLVMRGTDFGLASPIIPWVWQRNDEYTTIVTTTTSTTFVPLWTMFAFVNTPWIRVGVRITSPFGTAGEVRLFDVQHDVAIGNVLSFTDGANFLDYLLAPIPVTNYETGIPLQVDVQARVVSGAGPVRVVPFLAYGWPAP